jgi:amidase
MGTDSRGSIIHPASRNNVVGLRATVGAIHAAGIIPISSHWDSSAYSERFQVNASSCRVVGPLARNVYDAALAFQVVSGRTDCLSGLNGQALAGAR